MRRRLFLSRSAIALSAVVALSVAGISKGPTVSLVGCQRTGYFEVCGSPEDCQKFVEAFQTQLWPEWRTHSDGSARRIMRQCATIWREGLGLVSTSGKECRESLRRTLEQFGSQA